MKIQLLRHAAMLIEYGGVKILTDPMLGPADAGAPIPTKKEGRGRRNPLVELPLDAQKLATTLHSLDAVLITHLHSDHFDDFARKTLPKDIPLLCQAEDERRLHEKGFTGLFPIRSELGWAGIRISRVGCRHGGPLIRRKMGMGSGYCLEASSEPSLYITGDTIWCPEVKTAIRQHSPDLIIVNAGAAQLPAGRSITMRAGDVAKVCRDAPEAQVVAVHMEAINHCLLTRTQLRTYLEKHHLSNRVDIPADGETLAFNRTAP